MSSDAVDIGPNHDGEAKWGRELGIVYDVLHAYLGQIKGTVVTQRSGKPKAA